MEASTKTPRARRMAQPIELINVPEALLRVDTVAEVCGLAPRTIWKMVKAGKFPAPLHLQDPEITRWPSHVIKEYLRQRIENA